LEKDKVFFLLRSFYVKGIFINYVTLKKERGNKRDEMSTVKIPAKIREDGVGGRRGALKYEYQQN
jgi:hypothetical protein